MDGKNETVFSNYFVLMWTSDWACPVNVMFDGRLHFPTLVLFLTGKKKKRSGVDLVPGGDDKKIPGGDEKEMKCVE